MTDAVNAPLVDCRAQRAKIPARGQHCLQIGIGAIQPRASAACDLRFRMATPFQSADRVATYAWISQGSASLQFRIRDSIGNTYETESLPIQTRNRWVRLSTDLNPSTLKRVGKAAAAGGLTWPIEILGYRIQAPNTGRQVVFVDDLEVEHRAAGAGVLRGEFQFNEPTRIYSPGSRVRAAVVLENTSRQSALPLSVNLSWQRNDGAEIAKTRVSINLPSSGVEYRSRQPVDFSQEIHDSGLYHLIAEVRHPLWKEPAVFQTTIAVTYPNRGLPRGRSSFFGLQSNLIRESAADQQLEIDIARDLGVQLLALETPWRMIEPKEGRIDFETLEALLKRLGKLDMAVMLILTEPPDWASRDPETLWKQQTTFCAAVVQRVGERLFGIRPIATNPGVLTDLDLRGLDALTEKIASVRRTITICAPPIRVATGNVATMKLPPLPADPLYELAFETRGSAETARAALSKLAEANNIHWSAKYRWFHSEEGLIGSGGVHDAVAMLHHYVQALREGVGGVVWYELRDDTNDARFLDQMRGLVQRDFSPKNALIGFANVVGVLNGLVYVGSLPGTPTEFDSSLFIGGNRQVAVLCPKPNRVLPAVISPYQIAAGDLAVFDFDRRALPMTAADVPPLVQSQQRPCFIALTAREAQGEPQIGLARPWIEVPRTVYCGEETSFHIRLNAPTDLRRSYLQLELPSEAPLKSSLSSRGLRAKAGETLDFDVSLKREAEFRGPIICRLRVSIEGRALQIPIEICPQTDIGKLTNPAALIHDSAAIGLLSDLNDFGQPAGKTLGKMNSSDDCLLYAGYQGAQLHLAAALPPQTSPTARLYVGLAVENSDAHIEVCIENLITHPVLQTIGGTAAEQLRHCRCDTIDQASRKFCHVQIAPPALNLAQFTPHARLLLSVRYEEPATAAWGRPTILEWGSGLVEERNTALYRWVALGGNTDR